VRQWINGNFTYNIDYLNILKRTLLLIILFLDAYNSYGQGWVWAKTLSCASNGSTEMEVTAFDKTRGWFYAAIGNVGSDSLCLPPYTIHKLHDSQQAVIVKYDSAGNILWVRESSSSSIWIQRMTVDVSGNLYVFGCFNSLSISFGADTITNPDFHYGPPYGRNNCYFVSKYDIYGNLKWIKSGVNLYFYGAQSLWMGDIDADVEGNVYISGTYLDSVITIGSYTFTNSHYADTSTDILLAKYDSSGNVIWAKTFGGTKSDMTLGLAVGTNNRVYMTGHYISPTLTFGGITLTNTGSVTDPWTTWRPNAFLTAFDKNGTVLWAKTSAGNAYSNTIALDGDNNIFICGETFDTLFVTFGNDTIRNARLPISAYLAKFDTAGNDIWIKGFYPVRYSAGSWQFNMLFGLTTDQCNNVWSAGYMDPDTAGIIIDSGLILYPPAGYAEDPMFMVGYGPSGTLLQHFAIRTAGDDGPGLEADCKGNIYFAGDFNGMTILGDDTLYFPGSGEVMFVAKYNPGLGCSGICNGGVLLEKKQTADIDISLYPNPATSSLTITYNGPLSKDAYIFIYDLTGRLMYACPLTGNETTISVANLSQGMYICRINANGHETVSRKLVVMR
jgi:hypothetical protein